MPASAQQLTAALRGRYDILRPLGRGGMALVYLAQDCRHHRQVALKIFRPELVVSVGTDRFLREIAIVSKLMHPNIVPLLDSGFVEGTLFYVMPYLAGESLRDRLNREGQLPVEEAVRIARSVALGLEYAHEMGVIHRDIKPANILLSGGEPVIADFGIARAVSVAGEVVHTDPGMAVGTAAYMSPEQAADEEHLDGRSDLYSLGCVLYEMLAGEPPFIGASAGAISSRKLIEPVPSLRVLRCTVPPLLEEVVVRSLARLPADRYATAKQMAEALEAVQVCQGAKAPAAEPVTTPPTSLRRLLPWLGVAGGVVTIAGLTATWILGWPWQAGPAGDLRLSVTVPTGTELYGLSSPVSLSPDGSTLVFAAGHDDSVRLYRRRLDDFATVALRGTEGGDSPFFSPDGRWVAFFARKARQLRKVPLGGGSPVTIARDLGMSPGNGVWGANDTIYFADMPDRRLSKVPAGGGPVGPVTESDPGRGWFRYPLQVLPDGRHALASVNQGYLNGLEIMSLETGEYRRLVPDAGDARLVGSRILAYVPWRRHEVMAVPFDPGGGGITGEPVIVLDSVSVGPRGVQAYLALAANGTLAYVPLGRDLDPTAGTELALVSREGVVAGRRLPLGSGPRFSPDGRRLVYSRPGPNGQDIWLYDLASGTEQNLTGDRGEDLWPIWSPDGRRIIFNSNRHDREGFLSLYAMPADGSGAPSRLSTGNNMHQQPFTWADSGRDLIYTQGPHAATGMDIWVVALDGKSPARALLQTAANETQPAASPDGRWLAWMTDSSGRPEVMVGRYPDGPAVRVSHAGGREPVWDPGGRTIFFRDLQGSRVMAAGFEPGDPPRVAMPRPLFSGRFGVCYLWCRDFDVRPDGAGFVMRRNLEGLTPTGYWAAGTEVRIVPHWDREVRARLRAAQP